MGHGLRIAVLGQGSIGRRHAELLRDLGATVVTYDPVAPADTDDEKRALAGADAAVVASPSSEHERQALSCISAGIPALVEKPLALDSWRGARVRREAVRTGTPVAVAMNLRHHPGVRGVRAALPSLGRPLRAAVWCGSWLPGWRPQTDYRQSYSARRELGGGVLLDVIHEIDELTWLLGPAKTVSAELAHVSDLEIDVEDVAELLLELGSGVTAAITLDYVDRAYHRGCRVVGTSGTVAWEWSDEQVVRFDENGRSVASPAPADAAATYRAELTAFADALRSGAVAGATLDEAVHALQIVDAARWSAATGRRVVIGPVLRPTRPDDAELVLSWRNDPRAVAASLTGASVKPEEHRTWYRQLLTDPARMLWILEDSGRPAGSLRLDVTSPEHAEVSIVLDPLARGLGLGRTGLQLLAEEAPDEIRTIIARVRQDNAASLGAFRAAGYQDGALKGGVITLALER